MNYLKYNQPGGFRLSTEILAAAQTAYTLFNQLGWIAGDLTIISGCTVTGNSVSDGYVFINGEVLPFRGGNAGANVIVKEDIASYPFQDGTVKPVIYERYAGFGTALPENTYPWASFKRIFPTKDIQAFKDDFETRIAALENKASDVPSGTIVRYNQPLVVLPPDGWEDYSPTTEQGRVWAARSTSDSDFALGVTGGEKTHQLSVSEMPEHFHLQGSESLYNDYGSGTYVGARTYPNGTIASYRNQKTSSVGGNAAHNNLQPYVAVRYIIKL
ncbi:MAG: hypothetical protein QM564_11750 [Bergeyella sp.]